MRRVAGLGKHLETGVREHAEQRVLLRFRKHRVPIAPQDQRRNSKLSEPKEAEVALCTAGIGVEFGFQYDRIPPNEMESILAAFPRLEMKRCFTDSVCRIVRTKPETTYDNFARDFGERFVPGYQRPSTVDFLMNAPFEE
jgi:hypothetical protein